MEGRNPAPTSRLLQQSRFDAPDDMDRAWAGYFEQLESSLSGVESEVNANLQAKVSSSGRAYAEVSLALLYGVLTDIKRTPMFMKQLVMISRDGYALCMKELQRLVSELFPRFGDIVRAQLLWLTREFIALDAIDVEGLCYALLRQVCGSLIYLCHTTVGSCMETLQCEEKVSCRRLISRLATIECTHVCCSLELDKRVRRC
jgi:hypothetical protein